MTDLSYFPEKIDSLFFRDICPVFSMKGRRKPVSVSTYLSQDSHKRLGSHFVTLTRNPFANSCVLNGLATFGYQKQTEGHKK